MLDLREDEVVIGLNPGQTRNFCLLQLNIH
jgi:hypothetical protein